MNKKKHTKYHQILIKYDIITDKSDNVGSKDKDIRKIMMMKEVKIMAEEIVPLVLLLLLTIAVLYLNHF